MNQELIARCVAVWSIFGVLVAALMFFTGHQSLPERIFVSVFGGMIVGFVLTVPALVTEYLVVRFLERGSE